MLRRNWGPYEAAGKIRKDSEKEENEVSVNKGYDWRENLTDVPTTFEREGGFQ